MISQWHSIKGKRTTDNRDTFAFARKNGQALYVVADGSTSSQQGGELAKALCQHVIDVFKDYSKDGFIDHLQAELASWQPAIRQNYPNASAGYCIAWVPDHSTIHTLHAGDCRLGFANRPIPDNILWQTRIHSLANAINDLPEAELREHPARHLLTRSFNSRRYIAPEQQQYKWSSSQTLVIATDGFWADRTLAQQHGLLGEYSFECEPPEDDTSFLLLTSPDSFINIRTR